MEIEGAEKRAEDEVAKHTDVMRTVADLLLTRPVAADELRRLVRG